MSNRQPGLPEGASRWPPTSTSPGGSGKRTVQRRRKRKHQKQRYDFMVESDARMGEKLTFLRNLVGGALMPETHQALRTEMFQRALKHIDAEIAVREAHTEQAAR